MTTLRVGRISGRTLSLVALVVIVAGFIALQQMHAIRQRYILGNMKHELRVLAAAQEAYRGSTGRFTADLSLLGPLKASVQIQVFDVTDSGWRAIASHEDVKERCTLEVQLGRPYPRQIPCER